MSIETLLEAAKFLELQAQQQQKAREDELKEKLRLLQKTEFIYQDVGDGLRVCPAPVPPPLPPPSTPLTVTPNPSPSPALPVTARSPPAVPSLASPLERSSASTLCSPPPKTDHATATVTTNHRQNHYHHSPPTDPTSNTKPLQQLIQCYPGPVLPVLQPAAPPNGPVSLDSPPDDGRQLDNKKRPGGAGTREVHNKLEKHRRAHLKECFEMLKKNIPNIDEKKTSNLSVLRSALRYIQTLKRKEKEYEHDMERLAREKIATQQRLAELKNDLSQWMDVMEIERILRQTVQPEDDQASTSTASEGEDAMEDEADRETTATPTAPHNRKPEQHKTETHSQPPAASAAASIVTQHVSAQNKPPVLHPAPPLLSKPAAQTAATPTQPAAAPNLHPTVIAHASVSHPSVIQAVNHVIHRTVPKHLTPSSHQAISHFTVHPMANLSQHIPALYSQPVVGHITHTLNHAHPHVNSTSPTQAAATLVSKHGAIGTQMITHSPQLMGQAVLNPVTMVTMPSFPISTLKLA